MKNVYLAGLWYFSKLLDYQFTLFALSEKGIKELNTVGNYVLNHSFVFYIYIYFSTFLIFGVLHFCKNNEIIKHIAILIILISLLNTVCNMIVTIL